MIGRIRGTLAQQWGDRVLVETASGVGYEVHVPARTLASLPRIGESTSLSIHTHVREDAILLFGFHDELDRAVFRLVLGVSGIGPKLALALVGTMDPASIARALERKDETTLARIPGIGKKTAARLCLELADKAGNLVLHSAATGPAPTAGPAAESDAREALLALGYAIREVDSALKEAAPTGDDTVQSLLRRALRALAPG